MAARRADLDELPPLDLILVWVKPRLDQTHKTLLLSRDWGSEPRLESDRECFYGGEAPVS